MSSCGSEDGVGIKFSPKDGKTIGWQKSSRKDKFTTIDIKKVVVNLSKKELTTHQTNVLSLGLNFIPTPSSLPQEDIITVTETLA